MTKDEEQKILDELGIKKSPMIGRCGTYRMPELNPNVITTQSTAKDTKQIYVGINNTTYDTLLETPTFFCVQRD